MPVGVSRVVARGAWSSRIVLALAGLTILSGLGQAALPGSALSGMGVPADQATRLFFILMSLLVALFGAMLLVEGLRPPSRSTASSALLWVGLQKAVSVVALLAALLSGLLAPVVWAVVAFDGAAGAFLLVLWNARRGLPGQAARG